MNLEHHLRAQILDGRLPPGARLPSERSLAQEHGVNRVTVRTALERLKASGLLTAHVGRGTVVCDVQTQGGPDLLPDLLRDAEASGGLADVVEELFFVRQHLARAVLERIAQRRPNPAPFHRAVAACSPRHCFGARSRGVALPLAFARKLGHRFPRARRGRSGRGRGWLARGESGRRCHFAVGFALQELSLLLEQLLLGPRALLQHLAHRLLHLPRAARQCLSGA